ncbi:hypothetical protein, partial [uncultured Campylobacter sp.]|uniref:hypothetical protein n=1 Tax=uncultured Campylobacter sp. TaxID=218934 RepID=UPI0026387B69
MKFILHIFTLLCLSTQAFSAYVSGASIDSAANLILNAENDVNINSAKEKLSYNFKSKGGYYKEDIVKNTSSRLNAKDN